METNIVQLKTSMLQTRIEENKLNIPQDFIESFCEHYENRDILYTLEEVTKIVYKGEYDEEK